jgi:hypothetical protein
MESIVKNTMVVKLVLSSTEASMLKSLVQNSHPDESEDVSQFKESLFNSIPEFEELNKTEY